MRTLLLAAALAIVVPQGIPSVCDSVQFQLSRPEGQTTLLATVAAPVDLTPQFAAKILAGRLDDVATPAGPAILVPWKHSPDCKPLPWKGTPPWDAPADAAVYSGRLRPRATWIGGAPTFDIYLANLQPLWKTNDHRAGFFSGSPIATPAEFYEFHVVLPTHQELAEKRPGALKRLDAWEAANRPVVAREPIKTILGNLRRNWRVASPPLSVSDVVAATIASWK